MSVEIAFLANMDSFIRDVRQGRTELEDVSGALDDVRADASQAATKLERSFDEIAASARKVNPRETIARPMTHATHEASEGVKSLRENTASNLKEMAASTTGSVSDISSGLQGLLAELLEGFGPAGLVAGVAAAGALGVLTSQFEAQGAAAEAERQTVGQLTQQLIDAGHAGQQNLGDVAERMAAIASESDASKLSLHDIAGIAREINVPFADLARHVAEGGDATQYAIDRTQALIDAEKQRALEQQAQAGQTVTLISLETGRVRQLEQQRDRLKAVQRETTEAAKREREWLAAGGDRLQRKAAGLQTYADSIQAALHDAGTSWDEYAGKEGGLSLAKYQKVLREKNDAIAEYQANMETVARGLNEDALGYIESLGIEAAPLLAKFVKAPRDVQDDLIAEWTRAGRLSGKAFNQSLQDRLDQIRALPVDLTVVPQLDKSKFQTMVDALKNPLYVDVVPRAIAKPGLYGARVP